VKIGVISDTHIPDRALQIPSVVLEDFRNVDIILHAGDLTDISVLQILRSLGKKVYAVGGNMDSWELRCKLPEKEIIPLAAGLRLGLIHGEGNPRRLIDWVGTKFHREKPNIIVFGHAHYAVNERKAGILYFNPGSPTEKIFAPYNSYGIIHLDQGVVKAEIIKL
jgi:putative phosphoesterase